ncbi:Tol-Pal system protein TolB [Frankliniella fusca]|uniref:Tol-Pal system protein TolB n=1 Tax=Frankliniella fusca TaxID=407009 RepID=A0AAE1GV71_9NEOP|nr:Tol-Pal system protein TolB [Frankliniella fusca]
MIGAMPAVAVRHERQKQQKRSKWSSSLALQTPLTISGLTMIGAMPAVAVRHERRKQERRHKRPSQLGIQSPPGAADSLDNVGLGLTSPEPLQSPPQRHDGRQEYYVCGKVSLLHLVVVSLLLGAILVIVGLVQLTPGADASQHRYLLLGGGGTMLLFGILLAVLRCCVLPWRERRLPGATRGGGGVAAEASGSGSGSVRDGSRSRTNSATNGQVGRRASAALGVCTPTGGQRRRSLLEVERGMTLHGAAHGAGGAAPLSHVVDDATGAAAEDPDDDAQTRAEIQNHMNEMTAAAPGELAATFPVALTAAVPPPPAPAPAPGAADT